MQEQECIPSSYFFSGNCQPFEVAGSLDVPGFGTVQYCSLSCPGLYPKRDRMGYHTIRHFNKQISCNKHCFPYLKSFQSSKSDLSHC